MKPRAEDYARDLRAEGMTQEELEALFDEAIDRALSAYTLDPELRKAIKKRIELKRKLFR